MRLFAMLKYPVPAFVYAVLCVFSLSYSLPSFAAVPATVVTTADYQIGAEAPPDNPALRKRLSTGVVQQKRHLVSLYGGESGDSVPERGFLTDVVWGEQTTTGTVKHERILYYSFNVGQWKRKLNSETTVLTRAFMTQPLLVFLNTEDKSQIAEKLAQTSLFVKAVAEHKKSLINPLQDSGLLDDLIATLGEKGVVQLSIIQRQTSEQALTSRIAEYEKNFKRALSRTATVQEINFSNITPTPKYKIFKGLTVSGTGGTPVATGAEKFKFTSYSSLYYGVQQLSQFTNLNTPIWDNLTVPLIKPVTGWLDKDLVKNTPVGISKIKPLETVGNSAQVVIFRNNPNVYFDAPMRL
jgi:hypothetical protein